MNMLLPPSCARRGGCDGGFYVVWSQLLGQACTSRQPGVPRLAKAISPGALC